MSRFFTDPNTAAGYQFIQGGQINQLSDVDGHRQFELVPVCPVEAEEHLYEVIDLTELVASERSHGTYATLEEACGCVEFDRLEFWQIWYGYVGDRGDFVGCLLVDGNDPVVVC
jgi:hypothetical protein